MDPFPDPYGSMNILPIEITMDNTEGGSKFVPNFVLRQLDDSRMELVNLDIQNILSIDLPAAEELPLTDPAVPARTGTDSVIQYLTAGPDQKPHEEVACYACLKCQEKFLSLSLFRRHFKAHRLQKEYSCSKCSASFNVQDNLKIHQVTHHLDHAKCPICSVSFIRKASLKSHVLIHQVEELIYCDLCDGEFQNDEDLWRHMESHALTKIPLTEMVCPHCKLNFTSWSDLKLHLDKHSEVRKYFKPVRKGKLRQGKQLKSCKCQYCGKTFPKESLLERHERIHTGEKPFKCHICEKGFSQNGTLRIHLNKHKGLKPFSCSLCPAKFTQKGNLRAHIEKTHTAPKDADSVTYKCPQCACVFRKLATLNGHMTKAHATEGEVTGPDEVILTENHANGALERYVVRHRKIGDVRNYFCNDCPARFKKGSDLIRHFRTHTREKPFVCNRCGRGFSLKCTLATHMKLHLKSGSDSSQDTNLANYQCKMCKTQFGKLVNLRKHMLIHVGDRKFKCSSCPKAFLTKYALKEHTNHHNQIKNHACSICGKRFVTASMTKRHMVIHSKLFKCSHCDRTFRSMTVQRSHVRIAHPDTGDASENVENLLVPTTDVDTVDRAPDEPPGTSQDQTEEAVEIMKSPPEVVVNLPAAPLPDPPAPLPVETQPSYQMVYLNVSDLRQATPQGALLDASSLSLLPSLPLENIVLNLDSTTQPTPTTPNQSELATLDVTSVTDVGGVIPINVIDASALNVIPYDAQVICVNCQRMFPNCHSFDSHQCGADESCAPTDVYENKNLTSEAVLPDLSRLKRFAHKKPLQAELQKIEEPKQYRCEYCDYTSSVEERFRKHLLVHPNLSSKICKYCFKLFKKPSDLQRHLRVHTGERPFDCQHCHRKFALKSTLDSHLRTHEVPNLAKISCDVCNYNFSTKSSLKVHQLLHTGVRPYPCRYCEQTFRTSSIRKSHEKSRHKSENPQETPMNSLDWVLQQIQDGGDGQTVISDNVTVLLEGVGLTQSVEESKKAKPKPQKAECDICRKVYASKDVLRKHKKALHGQNRKFPCIKCDKGYDQLEDLNLHIAKLHSGLRPYSCQYCPNSFGEEHSLKTHIKRIHQKCLVGLETTDALRGLQLEFSSENGFI